MKKICLIASSGGHLEEVTALRKLSNYYEIHIVTEGPRTMDFSSKNYTWLLQINRREFLWPIKILYNSFLSLSFLISVSPQVIISTGALSTIPMMILGKIMNKKIIYIETMAKVSTPSLTGKFVYKFADLFIYQWPALSKYYPKGIYLGSIF
ncbi:hypothetical protein ATX87_07455 [Oenococcus oeni]|nr:PssD/Cps14F family polysaccharide biosynthesis glycosyltransferase [Oenococcus oeni]OIM62732.1 hypothetical protein ATX87_07455 [Oenococcus oeni]